MANAKCRIWRVLLINRPLRSLAWWIGCWKSAWWRVAGRKVIAGHVLAEFARSNAGRVPPDPLGVGSSARNRFVGLVTKVVTDKVMAQVEMQCGPFSVVSLMSADAVRELQLEPGSVAVAVVKATTVIVETPGADS